MNQDYAYLSTTGAGGLENLFVVADGMGGHKGGGYASHLAVESMLSFLDEGQKSDPDCPEQILTDAIQRANGNIWRTSLEDDRLAGMGTTVVAATFCGGVLVVANVGDSRLYVSNEKEIRQITQDHSLVEEMVRAGSLSKEQARNHPDRNIITRAVGVEEDLKVDCFFVPLKEGDKVLLCSDGLTNMLEDEEIRQILQLPGSVEERAHELVRTANEHGGRDNIAVIVMEPYADEVNP